MKIGTKYNPGDIVFVHHNGDIIDAEIRSIIFYAPPIGQDPMDTEPMYDLLIYGEKEELGIISESMCFKTKIEAAKAWLKWNNINIKDLLDLDKVEINSFYNLEKFKNGVQDNI